MATQRSKIVGHEVSGESDSLVPSASVSIQTLPGNTGIVEVHVSRTMTVQPVQYESLVSSASATMKVDKTADFDAVAQELSEVLDTIQYPDMILFKKLSRNKDSYIHGLIPGK